MLLTLPLCLAPIAALAPAPQGPQPIQTVLAIESLGQRGRSPIFTDGLEYARTQGDLEPPTEGSTLRAADGEIKTWARMEADAAGNFTDASLDRGWVFTQIPVTQAGSFILQASGHSYALVDGIPRAGDSYKLGTTRLPMYLREGVHDFYFYVSRLPFTASLLPAPLPVFFEEVDRTQPDAIDGIGGRVLIGQLISNASNEVERNWTVTATPLLPAGTGAPDPVINPLGTLLPGSQMKHPLWIPVPLHPKGDEYRVLLSLRDERENTVHQTTVTMEVKRPNQTHRRTFLSAIDGSVQYFAVTPPVESPGDGKPLAMILSLHGASVEAINHATAYEPKPWGVIVAPTNRRPFGFDWEDWGRKDALEVLAIGETLYQTDKNRTYLTGHSMGGHGTWQVGVHHSDRFAAIAPCAGWLDFWTYAGGMTVPKSDPIGELLSRSVNASRTGLLTENLQHQGVYVFHGDADKTVPVALARDMRNLLGSTHTDFAYREYPGGSHWWGKESVDWPPLFSFLRNHSKPNWDLALELEFHTVSPAIRSQHGWLRIERTAKSMLPAQLKARLVPTQSELFLEGENLARVVVDLTAFSSRLPVGKDLTVYWEDTQMLIPYESLAAPIPLQPQGIGGLKLGPQFLPTALKGPHRSGPFKEGFDGRMVFVYGTMGTPKGKRLGLFQSPLRPRNLALPRQRRRGNIARQRIPTGPLLRPQRGPVRQRKNQRRLGSSFGPRGLFPNPRSRPHRQENLGGKRPSPAGRVPQKRQPKSLCGRHRRNRPTRQHSDRRHALLRLRCGLPGLDRIRHLVPPAGSTRSTRHRLFPLRLVRRHRRRSRLALTP